MLELLKVPSNPTGTIQACNGYHKFTTEEIAQVKMLDLRTIMKDKGVKLSWANNQYEGTCPFHEDKARAPRLRMNQDKGVWVWNCEGGHHGGTVIHFIQEAHQVPFPRAMEYLRQLITPLPKLNGNGLSIKEILAPLQDKMDEQRQLEVRGSKLEEKDKNTFLLPTSNFQPSTTSNLEPPTSNISDDTATFKYGDLIYHAKGLKDITSKSLKIILKLTYQDGHFTDRIDLHSARARRSFSNQAAERLNLQSAQVEEHLEAMMEELETQSSVVSRSSLVKKEEMNEEEKQEAFTLLKDPNLLDRMASDLDKLGYVGEAINKKLLYLVGTSRLLDKPISAIIRSGSGAGKSALMEQVLTLMPPEDVLLFSRITPQSLFYMGKEALDRKILAIDEREGSQQADYSIRTLQSRGKLTLAASQKDPKSGEWKTLVREFEARTPYIESSTRDRINEENLNRSFELYLDETPEQTKKILEAQRKAAAGIDQITEAEKTHLKKLYQNAQRLLHPIEIKIPYELEVSIPQNWLRTRRDHERFLSLIKVIALVHQKQRPTEEDLKATPEDIGIARALLSPVIGELTSDLPKPVAVFYELLKKKVHEESGEISIEDYQFTRRQVRTWLGLPDHIVKRCIKMLEELEYVDVKKSSRGSRYQYHLASL